MKNLLSLIAFIAFAFAFEVSPLYAGSVYRIPTSSTFFQPTHFPINVAYGVDLKSNDAAYLQALKELNEKGLNTLFLGFTSTSDATKTINGIRASSVYSRFKYIIKIDTPVYDNYFSTCKKSANCPAPQKFIKEVTQFALQNSDLIVGYYTFDEPAGSGTPAYYQEAIYQAIRSLDPNIADRPISMAQTMYFNYPELYTPNGQDILFIDQYSADSEAQTGWFKSLAKLGMLDKPFIAVVHNGQGKCPTTDNVIAPTLKALYQAVSTVHAESMYAGTGYYVFDGKFDLETAPFAANNCPAIRRAMGDAMTKQSPNYFFKHNPMNLLFGVNPTALSSSDSKYLAELLANGVNTIVLGVGWNYAVDKILSQIRTHSVLSKFKYILAIDGDTYDQYFFTCKKNINCPAPMKRLQYITDIGKRFPDLVGGYLLSNEPAAYGIKSAYQVRVYQALRALDPNSFQRPVLVSQTMWQSPGPDYYSADAQDILVVMDQYIADTNTQTAWYKSFASDPLRMLDKSFITVLPNNSNKCAGSAGSVYQSALGGIYASGKEAQMLGVGLFSFHPAYGVSYGLSNCAAMKKEVQTVLQSISTDNSKEYYAANPLTIQFGISTNRLQSMKSGLEKSMAAGVNTIVLNVSWNWNLEPLMGQIQSDPILNQFKYILDIEGDTYDQYFSVCRANPNCGAPEKRIQYIVEVAQKFPRLIGGYLTTAHPQMYGIKASYQQALYQSLRGFDPDTIHRPVILTQTMYGSPELSLFSPGAMDVLVITDQYTPDQFTENEFYRRFSSARMLDKPYIIGVPKIDTTCNDISTPIFNAHVSASRSFGKQAQVKGVAFMDYQAPSPSLTKGVSSCFKF